MKKPLTIAELAAVCDLSRSNLQNLSASAAVSGRADSPSSANNMDNIPQLAALFDLHANDVKELIRNSAIPDPGAGIPAVTRAYIKYLRAGKKTVEETCELLDITPRHWSRLLQDGNVFQHEDGAPDVKRSIVCYIRFLRDGMTADARVARNRKLVADAAIAESKRAERERELVPAIDYQTNYSEAVTKICLAVSRMKDVTAEKVIEAIKTVELEPLEFAKEEAE